MTRRCLNTLPVARMSYCDFSTHFQRVEICNIQPDMLTETDGATKCWEYSIKEGSWKRKVNAGGCRNNPGETMQRIFLLLSDVFFFLIAPLKSVILARPHCLFHPDSVIFPLLGIA